MLYALLMKKIFCVFLLITSLSCTSPGEDLFQGYTEGKFVYISSPIGGTLELLKVDSGQSVAQGDPLFSLEQDLESAAMEEARETLQQTEHNLDDLRKGLRAPDLEAIKARREQAEEYLKLSEKEYQRRVQLFKNSSISEDELERTRTDFHIAEQKVEQVRAELESGGLGGREDLIRAAESRVKAAEARLVQIRWTLDQKTKTAPVGGLVFDTNYQQGEWVGAGRPEVALLPPENIKIRFFVPERLIKRLHPGQEVEVIITDDTPI